MTHHIHIHLRKTADSGRRKTRDCGCGTKDADWAGIGREYAREGSLAELKVELKRRGASADETKRAIDAYNAARKKLMG